MKFNKQIIDKLISGNYLAKREGWTTKFVGISLIHLSSSQFLTNNDQLSYYFNNIEKELNEEVIGIRQMFILHTANGKIIPISRVSEEDAKANDWCLIDLNNTESYSVLKDNYYIEITANFKNKKNKVVFYANKIQDQSANKYCKEPAFFSKLQKTEKFAENIQNYLNSKVLISDKNSTAILHSNLEDFIKPLDIPKIISFEVKVIKSEIESYPKIITNSLKTI